MASGSRRALRRAVCARRRGPRAPPARAPIRERRALRAMASTQAARLGWGSSSARAPRQARRRHRRRPRARRRRRRPAARARRRRRRPRARRRRRRRPRRAAARRLTAVAATLFRRWAHETAADDSALGVTGLSLGLSIPRARCGPGRDRRYFGAASRRPRRRRRCRRRRWRRGAAAAARRRSPRTVGLAVEQMPPAPRGAAGGAAADARARAASKRTASARLCSPSCGRAARGSRAGSAHFAAGWRPKSKRPKTAAHGPPSSGIARFFGRRRRRHVPRPAQRHGGCRTRNQVRVSC